MEKYKEQSTDTVIILGEQTVHAEISSIITSERTYFLNLYGEQGSGKTELLQQLQNEFSFKRFITVKEEDDLIQEEDMGKIFVMDDVDHLFSREQFKEMMLKLFSHHSHAKVIFTSKNKFFLETLPGIHHYTYEVGNRVFSLQEFRQYVGSPKIVQLIQGIELPEFIIKNTYLFASYCRNFNYVVEVLKRIGEKGQGRKLSPKEFITLLTSSSLFSKLQQDLVIDTKHVDNSDYLFMVRTKDKVEKLRDLLLKYYPEDSLMLEVMKNQFNSSFIDDTFNLPISYEDKVLNVCLTYDPVDLIVKLLGPRDIITELKEREVGEATFTYSIVDKAKLILKDIGMNILDEPKGIEHFFERFQENNQLVIKDKLNKEYMIGLGISTFQDLEHIFYEMISFYGTYLFGSLSQFLEEYNRQQPANRIYEKRITFGQYIGLFTFINKLRNQEEYQLKFVQLNVDTLIPKDIIRKIEEISSFRNFFSHFQKVQNFDIPYTTYVNRIQKLYRHTIQLVELFINHNVFPEIIKIKEVIFDEFGRRLFVATDWKKSEIRFSLSGITNTIDIYSHYYILRKKQRIAINPILIPRYLDGNQDRFRGEEYDASSQTQFQQGTTLLSKIELPNASRVLDVGCGNGRTTIELWKKNQTATIDAFDLSKSMIETALKNQEEQEISRDSIHFYPMNAMDLEATSAYDVVFSNATLHWVVESKEMYAKLFRALKPNGFLAVHQGGAGCYVGLHDIVKRAIDLLDLEMYYQNWTYPIYYPSKNDFEHLLKVTGFTNVQVESVETDGSEYLDLEENFANAGMLPYLHRLPTQLQDKLKKTYLELCKKEEANKYTHRLYAFGVKGDL
ncbi:hypothetical protein Q75_15640 [Bacillus coahuilensis p1.1.43]|uniref:Methyltransferase domain-containing protein n=1 Tax=Bacillus coahuilensis p1.1.43 TaxID=1150625 RepID=A0A147K4P2_9BACI|nr:class I SAM-dependent methyltransferase [Bacillus coahuilensis]KUP04422.1 hypothetical protein Q75_15640 [Bacillus coahuilensis p1.1.43]